MLTTDNYFQQMKLLDSLVVNRVINTHLNSTKFTQIQEYFQEAIPPTLSCFLIFPLRMIRNYFGQSPEEDEKNGFQ